MVLSAKNLHRSTLHEQTYQALRESILSGELAPGDRVIEVQIAEQLQVSRTPIREAIRQLQREELIIAGEMGWLRVATLSVQEAKNLYDCRVALETLAVRGACETANAEQLKRLKDCITQAEKLLKRNAPQPGSNQLLELDTRFHRTIAQSSGNTCLVSLLDQVFGKMALLRAQTTRHNPRVLEIRIEHQTIYDAIARRKVEAAIQAIQNHLVASKDRVVQELEHLQCESSD